MTTPVDPSPRGGLAGPARRLAAALTRPSVARPRRTVALALLVAVAGLALAVGRLELRTSNLDLVDPTLPEVARYLDVADALGTPNLLVAVFEGDDPAALRRAVEQVGPRLATVDGARGALYRLPIDAALLPLLAARGIDPYFTSSDDRIAFAFVQPADARSRADRLAPFVAGVRDVLKTSLEELDDGSVRAGVTGMPAYALDDREAIEGDLGRLSLLSAVLVAGLFASAFGAVRRPLLAVAGVLLALAWTAGAAALVPGHLTLLSAFFASILLGLGIDAGVHLVDRLEEERADAPDAAEADIVLRAVDALAPGLVTATATTASILFAMTASGFRGFAELGLIAGVGLVLCLLATLTVTPALLVLRPPPARPAPRRAERRLGRLLVRVQSRGAAVVLALAALAGFVVDPGFDADYLNLEPRGSEAVRLERAMVERSDWSPEMAVFLPAGDDDARRLVAALQDEPTVGMVRSGLDLEVLAQLAGESVDAVAARMPGWRTDDGRSAVYAFPADDIWRPDAQAAFVDAMRRLDPEVTGMPFLGRFMVERSRDALGRTALLGGLLLVAWVLLDFRDLRWALLALLPPLLTVGLLRLAMTALGVPFNPLDIMALPLSLGIAVDDGVHLVHRLRAEHRRAEPLRSEVGPSPQREPAVARALIGTGRAVLLTSLTTLAAFGALGLARHQGLASFGQALALGVAAALAVTILVLPPVLERLLPRLHRQHRQPQQPPHATAAGSVDAR